MDVQAPPLSIHINTIFFQAYIWFQLFRNKSRAKSNHLRAHSKQRCKNSPRCSLSTIDNIDSRGAAKRPYSDNIYYIAIATIYVCFN